MKSIDDENGHLLRTTTMSRGLGRHGGFDELKERVMTDVVLSALFAVIVALCLAMIVGLYCWGRHAQIFSPDAAAQPMIVETAI